MSSSSISSIGRASPQPHVTPTSASLNSPAASPASLRPPAPPRSRSGGPLNRFQSFSANQSTRTQTEAAVAHATPVAAVTVVAEATTAHVQNATEATNAHAPLLSPADAFRARAGSIDFSMPPLQQRIADLGNLVEEFTAFLRERGTLRSVGRDALIEHVARDMEAGDRAAHGQCLAAAREYVDTTCSPGFTAQHLEGAPIRALAGADGSHFARREGLRLLSAHQGRTEIERENNGAKLDEALAEAVTRLIEREQGMGAPHAHHAPAEMLLGLADADEGIKRGMLEAYVQDGGKEKLVGAMVAHWGARSGSGQIADARLQKPANDARAHTLMSGVLTKMAGELGGQPSLQQMNDGYVGMTKSKLDAYLGTRFAQ